MKIRKKRLCVYLCACKKYIKNFQKHFTKWLKISHRVPHVGTLKFWNVVHNLLMGTYSGNKEYITQSNLFLTTLITIGNDVLSLHQFLTQTDQQ